MVAVGLLWDDEIDWSQVRCALGGSEGVPVALASLAAAASEKEATEAYWKLDNVVVVQGSVFEAGPLVVEPLIRMVASSVGPVRRWSLELLLQMLGGWTEPAELERIGRDLVQECRARAMAGLEVFYAITAGEDKDCRELACEIARSVETRPGEFARRMRWLASRLAPSDADYVLGLI